MSEYGQMHITSTSSGIWEIEVEVDIGDDMALISILYDAKKSISEKHGIPISELKYKDIRKKKKSENKIDVAFTIVSDEKARGAPRLRTVKLTSSEGIEFEDMALYIDIYPLNPSDQKTSAEDIISLLEENYIVPEQRIIDNIHTYINRIQQENAPLLDVSLIQGLFPETSHDAELKYNCRIKKVDASNYIGVEKISKGQLLCSKHPAYKGKRSGRDIRGKELTPRQPIDIEIEAGENVSLSADGNQIFANCSGILHVSIDQSARPFCSSKLTFSLEPLAEYDGSKVISITVDKPIEIKGGLKAGSKIISQREVIVTGDVEGGASIQTSGSIHVEGNIIGSTLSSEKDIESYKNVSSSKLTAEGKLVIKGSAINSELIGHEVFVNEVSGCNIIAGSKIEINKVSPNEKGYCGFFKTGILYHLNEIIAENKKFIEFAQIQMDKVKSVFGEEIVNSINTMNVAQMLLRHSENLKKMGIQLSTTEQKEAVVQLMGAIAPIKQLASEKEKAIEEIEKQKAKKSSVVVKIVLNSTAPSPVEIEIDSIRDYIREEDGPVECTLSEERIIKQPIHK